MSNARIVNAVEDPEIAGWENEGGCVASSKRTLHVPISWPWQEAIKDLPTAEALKIAAENDQAMSEAQSHSDQWMIWVAYGIGLLSFMALLGGILRILIRT